LSQTLSHFHVARLARSDPANEKSMTAVSDFVKLMHRSYECQLLAILRGARQGCFIVMAALDAAIHASRSLLGVRH
jgi:hypothetical protein